METRKLRLFPVVILLLSACSQGFNPEFECTWGAKDAVLAKLKNPHTAKFDLFAGGETMAYSRDRRFYVVYTGVASENAFGGSVHSDFLLLMMAPEEGSDRAAQAMHIEQIQGKPSQANVKRIAGEIAELDQWHWCWEQEG